MSINFKAPERVVLKPIITVFGVGGAGGNAVNNMLSAQLQGANFVVANTDAQALEHSLCQNKIQLGAAVTKGLGAGASPEIGALAADESSDEIRSYLDGSNMVFITAGMGGGTGTGSSPIVAKIAKELGILTVGVVTKPFHFEGAHRMKTASKGIAELQQYVDTLIVIPNQNLFSIANERTTFADAFKMADDVLHAGVRGVTDLMIMPGLINLDFADIRSVMSEMGKAMMGTGEASGEDRAIKAAEAAISNPLLDHSSMKGARGVLINITGGQDMTLFEVDTTANRIREEVGDSEANIIFGSTFNPELQGIIRVSVVATGIDVDSTKQNIAAVVKEENIADNTDLQKPTSYPQEQSVITEEIPSFNQHIEQHQNQYQNIHNFQESFRPEESKPNTLHYLEKPVISQNAPSKSSLLSRMWNSLKTNEKDQVNTNQAHEYQKNMNINSNIETEIQDVPAFLRKK